MASSILDTASGLKRCKVLTTLRGESAGLAVSNHTVIYECKPSQKNKVKRCWKDIRECHKGIIQGYPVLETERILMNLCSLWWYMMANSYIHSYYSWCGSRECHPWRHPSFEVCSVKSRSILLAFVRRPRKPWPKHFMGISWGQPADCADRRGISVASNII